MLTIILLYMTGLFPLGIFLRILNKKGAGFTANNCFFYVLFSWLGFFALVFMSICIVIASLFYNNNYLKKIGKFLFLSDG